MADNQNITIDKSWLNLQFQDVDEKIIKKPNEFKIDKTFYPPSTLPDDKFNRIKGSLFGLALGDALGAHVEFRPKSYLDANPVTDLMGGGTWGLEKGQFTDDTSMALCLANSLIVCEDLVLYDQLVRYKWWYRYGYMSSTGHCFDIGSATRNSIQEFEERQRRWAQEFDLSYEEIDDISNPEILRKFDVNCSGEGVAGNGSLMRLAPVPLFFYQHPEKAVEYSGESSRITHGDEKACDACRYYGALIVAALHGATKDELTSGKFYEKHKPWFGKKALHPDIMKIDQGSYKKPNGYDDGIRGKGYVVYALEAALWAFWADDNSFDTGVCKAINLGDDTDTTAAIYGQLAGAYYGYKNLPQKWIGGIYAPDFINCISSWIAYEGNNWFSKLGESDRPPLYNSDAFTNRRSNSRKSGTNKRGYNSSMSNLSCLVIKRKAIDPTGDLGSLYDGWHDCIISSSENLKISKKPSEGLSVKCHVKTGDQIDSQNLLRIAELDSDLRVSVISNILPSTSIASIVDYPYVIDTYTRVFYYSYYSRTEGELDEKSIAQLKSVPNATHIVVGIESGIDVIAILRLSRNSSNSIDKALKYMCECLSKDIKPSADIDWQNRIISTHIYSNIPSLNNLRSMVELYRDICTIKQNVKGFKPCTYILHRLSTLCSDNNQNGSELVSLGQNLTKRIEDNLLRLANVTRLWLTFQKDERKTAIVAQYLKEQSDDLKKQFQYLQTRYNKEKERCKQAIPKMRHGYEAQKSIGGTLFTDDEQGKLREAVGNFEYSLMALEEKANLIIDLKDKGFEYRNAKEYNIAQNDDDKMIEKKLMQGSQRRVLCSSDILNGSHWAEFQHLCSQMSNDRMENTKLHLVYVDFSYCTYELNAIKTIPPIIFNEPSNKSNRTTSGPIESTKNVPVKPKIDQTINILLLGKTGVGKTTFINMIEHYLKFKTYAQAQSNAPNLVPCITFFLTIKDEFEEHFISMGKASSNADCDDSGYSVTRKCKTYVFEISHGRKLQIIDTPGINAEDSKALSETTIQHILSYVSGLTHLSAICVLIESGDIHLTVYAELLDQLWKFFGDKARNNIIFCITKYYSSSTHGDKYITDFKTKLLSLSNKISYNNAKIFSFDSSFFLNLITTRYSPEQPVVPCEKGWLFTKESLDQLLKYTLENLSPYDMNQTSQELAYVHLRITQLIRPIWESVRNITRNNILRKEVQLPISVELLPKPIEQPSAVCHCCRPYVYQFERFSIAYYAPHKFVTRCQTCHCKSNQHTRIDYQIGYELVDRKIDSFEEMDILKNELIDKSVHFFNFLRHTDGNLKCDPFLTTLDQIIQEENRFVHYHYHLHSSLYCELVRIRESYRQRLTTVTAKNELYDIHSIEAMIKTVERIPVIHKQICAIKNTQDWMPK